jgi:hypothetical protein
MSKVVSNKNMYLRINFLVVSQAASNYYASKKYKFVILDLQRTYFPEGFE